MSRAAVLLGAVVGVLALSGCASGGGVDSGTTQDAKPETRWTLRYEAGAPASLGTVVSGVSLDGDVALFPFTDRSVGPVDMLGALDLTTGKRRVLARSGFQGGSIVAAVRTGNEVVYVDESSRGDLDPGAARWRVIALSSHRVLASSGNRRATMSPDLTTIDGQAVWTVYPDHAGGNLRAFGWKPGGKVQRRDALPGDDLECTPPAPNPELVGGCDQRGGWLAWVERSAPDDATDPGQLFYARADGGGRRRIGTVLYDAGSPVIFGDYLLWDSGKGLEVTSLLHPSATVEVLPSRSDNPASSYGSGNDSAATLLTQEDGTTTLRIIDADHLRLTSSAG